MVKNPNKEFISSQKKHKGIIHSSHGDILIDTRTGSIRQTIADDQGKEGEEWTGWLKKISRFDLDEYHNYYKCHGETSFDILDLGYWIGEDYYPPTQAFRDEVRQEGELLDGL